MPAYLEIWRAEGPVLALLESDRCTLGHGESNDVVLSDRLASRLHAVLERYAAGWCIRDLNSRNGTFVNGERVFGERTLHAGDELRVGQTRLVFKSEGPRPTETVTETDVGPPELTRREREVLLALCRPLVGGDAFTQPAAIKEIAEALVVSEDAVKQHLSRLYDKFGVYEGSPRRVRLANEALRRGAVTFADLRSE
jgi:DNA-binding transcriptional ArsR family regulator